MTVWMLCTFPEGAMLKFCENLLSLKASRTPSKIDDICRFMAGVDDGFDVPDWGWCP